MTTKTNARLAGTAYLTYLAGGIGGMAVANHPGLVEIGNLIGSFSALTLGVTLYAITRDVDRDLAMFAMLCRVIEAVPGRGEIYFAVGNASFCWLLMRGRIIPASLGWLGFASSAALSALLLLQFGGLFGGRMNWSSPVTWFVWLPVLIFELAFAAWLLAGRVTVPRTVTSNQ
jgi:hypothetical protein